MKVVNKVIDLKKITNEVTIQKCYHSAIDRIKGEVGVFLMLF